MPAPDFGDDNGVANNPAASAVRLLKLIPCSEENTCRSCPLDSSSSTNRNISMLFDSRFDIDSPVLDYNLKNRYSVANEKYALAWVDTKQLHLFMLLIRIRCDLLSKSVHCNVENNAGKRRPMQSMGCDLLSKSVHCNVENNLLDWVLPM